MNKPDIKGLTFFEVEKLRERYGFNTIQEKEQSAFSRLLKKIIGPIPLMIEAALILSALTGKWGDFSIILVLLGINIIVDFSQEQKAYKALRSLKRNLAPTAVALRDGVFRQIKAEDLVPSDVIKLIIGDIVPADVVVLDGSYITVDQSMITGESLPAEKTNGDTVYSGSVVHKGSVLARVEKTGRSSVMGKSIKLVAQAEREEQSHFQKAVLNIGKFLILLSAVLIAISFTVFLLRGDSLLETMRFALILAVASIPVALPAVLSVTMAIGAGTLAKNQAIVTNFKSIEELAGVDDLCVDKTGTLTKNQIKVYKPKTYGNFTVADLFGYALWGIDKEERSVIEEAIYSFAQENNFSENNKYEIDNFIPFDPVRKMTEVSAHKGSKKVEMVMGAPQVIMKIVEKDKDSKVFFSDIESFAKDGFRTIAIAIKIKKDFSLVGIIPFFDPLRDDSTEIISRIRKKGIKIKMLTGDNSAIAVFISRALSIGKNLFSGPVIASREDKVGGREKEADIVEKTNIFAEITPEDKYHIVDVLQKRGHMVAMTGDGVNDAPALKKADIGIAVAGSAPAARSAADIILLDNGLSVIEKAIDYARMIFVRMQSYATFRISETIRIVFFVTFALLIFNYSPVSAAMIILLALLNDIPIMSIAYDNAPIDNRPTRWHLRETIFISATLGITGLISSFLLFSWLNMSGFDVAIIQTIMFLKLDVSGHSTLYLTRTGRKHFWQKPFPSLKFFIPAFGSRIVGTLFALYGVFMEPIGIKVVAYIWLYSTVWFLINDRVKVLAYKLLERFRKPVK